MKDKISRAQDLKESIEQVEEKYADKIKALSDELKEVRFQMETEMLPYAEELGQITDSLIGVNIPKGLGAYVRVTNDIKIVDESIIPDKFKTANSKLIKQFLKESDYTDDVPGVDKITRETVVIRKR